jgi:hypothetical protein
LDCLRAAPLCCEHQRIITGGGPDSVTKEEWHLDSITLPLPRWISTALKANYLMSLRFRLKRLLRLSRLGHLGCATVQNKHC